MGAKRQRDLTPDQAKFLARIIEAEIKKSVEHGEVGVGELLGLSQSAVNKLLSGAQGASMGLAVRVALILGRPVSDVIGLPPNLPEHADERIRIAMRAAVLQGVPLAKIQRALEAQPAFEGGQPGADDWFRRFSKGYVETAESDTTRARAAIGTKRKRS
jgi:hypothetical protein